jgi:hypothetical protein
MASVIISGTFSGTGQSAGVSCSKAIIDLTFAGTATVTLEWRVDNTNWRTVQTYTASSQIVFDPEVNAEIRLNCTAHTNNVTYAIRTR